MVSAPPAITPGPPWGSGSPPRPPRRKAPGQRPRTRAPEALQAPAIRSTSPTSGYNPHRRGPPRAEWRPESLHTNGKTVAETGTDSQSGNGETGGKEALGTKSATHYGPHAAVSGPRFSPSSAEQGSPGLAVPTPALPNASSVEPRPPRSPPSKGSLGT